MNIVKQLQKTEFKFVRLKKESKFPFDDEWKSCLFSFKDKELLDHKGNIGVTGIGGNLVIIDMDNITKEDMEILKAKLGDTFVVKTSRPSGNGFHLYYIAPGYTGGRKFKFKDGEIEIRTGAQYVVAPNCSVKRKEDGLVRSYDIINDIDICIINYSTIKKFIDELTPDEIIKNTAQINKDTLEYVLKNLNIRQSLNAKIHSEGTSGYQSRSHKDMAIIDELIGMGLGSLIKPIFETYPCGSKYREKGIHKKNYLDITIDKAIKRIGQDKYEKMRMYNDIKIEIISKFESDLLADYQEIFKKIREIKNKTYQKELIKHISKKTGLYIKDLIREFESNPDVIIQRDSTDAKDLLAKEFKEIEYWFYPLIPKDSLILIGGKAGNFKSLFTLLLSICMSTEIPFDNKFVVRGHPKIIYYDMEMTQPMTQRRMKTILKGMGKPELLNRLHLVYDFNKRNMEQERKESANFDIVILDSYRRFLEGDEKNSEITDQFYRTFLKPLRDSGKTVIILHHFRKSQADEVVDEDVMEMFRGSTDIPAQMDLMLAVFKTNESFEGGISTFNVDVKKAKNREGHPIQNFKMKVVKDDFLKKTTIDVIGFGDKKESLTLKIEDAIKEMLQISRFERRIIIVEAMKHKFNVGDRTIDNTLRSMVEIGLLENPKKGFYKLPSDTQSS